MWLNEESLEWTPIESSLEGNSLTCKANHFSEFAIVSTDAPVQEQSIFLPLVNK